MARRLQSGLGTEGAGPLSLGRLLRRRRNVYGFSSRRVSQRTLLSILEDATHVPSAGFTQDFDFVVVRDSGTKAKLASAAYEKEYVKAGHARAGFLLSAPVVVVPCANKARFEEKYGAPAERNARLPWWLIDSGFGARVDPVGIREGSCGLVHRRSRR